MRALEGGLSEVARTVHGHPTCGRSRSGGGPRSRRLASPRYGSEAMSELDAASTRPRFPTRISGGRAGAAHDARRVRVAADLTRGLPNASPSRPSVAAMTKEHVPLGAGATTRPARSASRLRWPTQFPFDSDFAMRVATYAKSIGKLVAFAQAAFRQAFAEGGGPLDAVDNVLIAVTIMSMHPSAVQKGAALRFMEQAALRSHRHSRHTGRRRRSGDTHGRAAIPWRACPGGSRQHALARPDESRTLLG